MYKYTASQQKFAFRDVETYLSNNYNWLHPTRKQECIEMIGELIDKATPTKPNRLWKDQWECPNCKVNVYMNSDEPAYCYNCGQALDWGVLDD